MPTLRIYWRHPSYRSQADAAGSQESEVGARRIASQIQDARNSPISGRSFEDFIQQKHFATFYLTKVGLMAMLLKSAKSISSQLRDRSLRCHTLRVKISSDSDRKHQTRA